VCLCVCVCVCVCIIYEWIMDVSVGRPVARDFSYRNEWRFINIIIIIIIIGRACVWANYYMHCRLVLTHTHDIYIYYCVWSIHPGNVTERRPNDRWTAIRRRRLCIYILYVFCSSLRRRPRITAVGPRAHRHLLYHINSDNSKDPHIYNAYKIYTQRCYV